MEGRRCFRVGETSFISNKRTWCRLTRDFLVTFNYERKLISIEFKGDSQIVYDDVGYWSIEQLDLVVWERLESR